LSGCATINVYWSDMDSRPVDTALDRIKQHLVIRAILVRHIRQS
jgi:hypothetical protein